MHMHATVQAWAKINLDLRILAREASGYHQLETIFQRIALADDVTVSVRPGSGIALQCAPPVDVPDARNLAWRAASAYRDAAHWPDTDHAITIDIAKRIPTGGGLGGGSADAGAVLRALNALNPAPLPANTLLALAAPLGADVPFLTSDVACALAWGRGERMLALDALPARRVHLAAFRDGVNTAAAYGSLAAARERGQVAPHPAMLHRAEAWRDWQHLTASAANDFETPVFALRPDVAQVHAAWRAAAPQALVRMSGSGATVFAIAADDAPLAAATSGWPADGSVSHLATRTLAQVPPVSILSAPSGFR